MANSFVVRDNDRVGIRRMTTIKGAVEPIAFDFSPWAEDQGNVTSATWSVIVGKATLSSKALSSNVASAVLSTPEPGETVIQILGIGATHTKPVRIRVYTRDESTPISDYGWHR
jgi:hypothetical protein